MSAGPSRIKEVEGYLGKKNDIIYHPPESKEFSKIVVFFGGDMQDYKENMLAHRDNKHYSEWDLESTAVVIHQHFPDSGIAIIKPSKMSLKTFSCYENFVEVNNFGAPTYSNNTDSLKHIRLLLLSLSLKLFCETAVINKPISLIGFSKGCVVLNQLLHSIHYLKQEPDSELGLFVKSFEDIYWIDGGHSGSSPTWITDKNILESFSKLNVRVHIHVTPYQVQCDSRPRIGKEEKAFRETLNRMGMVVNRRLHFEDEPRSLDFHFKVLKSFS